MVEYRGKDISEKRAKGLLRLLKTGLYSPKLSEEESKEYSVWKEHYQMMKAGGRRKIRCPINERGYLIWQLQNYFNIGLMCKSIDKVHEEMRQPTGYDLYKKMHTPFTPASEFYNI
jgi:hypothetical protein